MKSILTITFKEVRDSFFSPIAYVFITAFIVLSYWIYFTDFFVRGQASLRLFFDTVVFLFPILLPAITMGRWADEKRAGSLEILLTLPVTDMRVVTGKFLAAQLFLLITLGLTLPLPLVVSFLGDLDWGSVWGGYLGLLLLGQASLAIGLFISSLTESSLIAFILTFLVLSFFHLIGSALVSNYVPEFVGNFLVYTSTGTHFESLARGVIDSRDVLYYVSLGGFFLFLNYLSLESRKWEK